MRMRVESYVVSCSWGNSQLYAVKFRLILSNNIEKRGSLMSMRVLHFSVITSSTSGEMASKEQVPLP